MPYKNSGFAGEMLVAAELSRLGYEVLIGNVGSRRTVGVDLAAVHPATGKTVSISVKSLKSRNAFLINPDRVKRDFVYVFVITNPAGALSEFFVLSGRTLLRNQAKLWRGYGANYKYPTRRGIQWRRLEPWRARWGEIGRV